MDFIKNIKDALDLVEGFKSKGSDFGMGSQPILAVDVIIEVESARYILVKRRVPPFRDFWALPGGVVGYGESVEDAVRREVLQGLGLEVEIIRLGGVYSNPVRDPRGHVVSICFLCRFVKGELNVKAGGLDFSVFSVDEVSRLQLAFDHLKMLKDAGVL